MMIGEIIRGMNGISVKGKITAISETRTVQTRYGERSVADATLEDKTGKIKLSLWEENIKAVGIGDEVSVEGAYITEFRNQLQLNIPRSGKIKVIKQNINKDAEYNQEFFPEEYDTQDFDDF
jgi:replication factor A1